MLKQEENFQDVNVTNVAIDVDALASAVLDIIGKRARIYVAVVGSERLKEDAQEINLDALN